MAYQAIHSSHTKLLSFSRSHKPLVTINSGDSVVFDNRHAGFHKITETTTTEDLVAMNIKGFDEIESVMGKIYVDGPIYVNDTKPGDILQVEVVELETGTWGWTAIFPGLGLLSDEIRGPYIKTFDLRKDFAIFKPGVKIPSQPFYGTMGVAPGTDEELHPLPPRNDIGGNFDCRYLGVGSKLFLPVNVEGALFSVGDGHYCQGDGEIVGTAIETGMKSRIRLSVVKGNKSITQPHYKTDPERTAAMHKVRQRGEYGVLATAATREEAVKTAVKGIMEWMEAKKGLTRVEAYMLFGIAGNLKTMHDVGVPIHTMSASIPLGLFDDEV